VSAPNDERLEDDAGLESYLRRESDVSRRYHELEADDVPPQLDAAVIARARAALEPAKRKPAWVKWGAPLALAASAVLVVAIVLEVGVQEEVRMPAPQVELTTKAAPAPPAEIAPASQSAEAPRVTADDASANAEAPQQRKATTSRARSATSTDREAVAETVVTTSQPFSAPVDAPQAVPQTAHARQAEIANTAQVPGQSADQVPGQSADLSRSEHETAQFASGALDSDRRQEQVANVPAGASRSTAITPPVAPVAAPRAPAPSAQAPRLAPEAWLEQIRVLRREGKVIEADRQWREFRESYPQFEVSETDAARPKP
jgi:hypothetical protein